MTDSVGLVLAVESAVFSAVNDVSIDSLRADVEVSADNQRVGQLVGNRHGLAVFRHTDAVAGRQTGIAPHEQVAFRITAINIEVAEDDGIEGLAKIKQFADRRIGRRRDRCDGNDSVVGIRNILQSHQIISFGIGRVGRHRANVRDILGNRESRLRQCGRGVRGERTRNRANIAEYIVSDHEIREIGFSGVLHHVGVDNISEAYEAEIRAIGSVAGRLHNFDASRHQVEACIAGIIRRTCI